MRRNSATTPYSKKSFGQNFLTDYTYVRRIIDALNPGMDDIVVEIGPGRGALTERLVERAKNVIAIELDRDMIGLLRERFAGCLNLRLVEQDALRVDFIGLLDARRSDFKPAKLVANLPYYISTAVLQRLIEERTIFSEVILMFQREVVERITAPPGSSDRGFLTVLVEAHFVVTKLFDVPPTAFRPVPKVWSSVVRLQAKQSGVVDEDIFRSVAACAFSQKRKTLLNNLKRCLRAPSAVLDNAGVDGSRRAESLTADEWIRLVEAAQTSDSISNPEMILK